MPYYADTLYSLTAHDTTIQHYYILEYTLPSSFQLLTTLTMDQLYYYYTQHNYKALLHSRIYPTLLF